MNLPAAVSLCVATSALLLALLTLRLAASPGWRELRWFSLGSTLAAAFCLCNAAIVVGQSVALTRLLSAAELLIAALHGTCWFLYMSGMEHRPLTRAERSIIFLALVLGVLAQVPGAAYAGELLSRPVPLLGIVYQDARPTTFGLFVYAASGFFMLWLTVHYVVAALRRVPWALHHAVGMGALLLSVVHDSFAAAGALSTPYLIDLGYLAVVFAVGSAIGERYVQNARVLQVTSQRLGRAQAELVRHERLAALGELSAQMAHEVRQPVGVMFNVVAALRRDGALPEASRELVTILDEEAERLRRIVDDLLTFAGQASLDRQPVDAWRVVAEAVESARATVESSGARVEVAAADGPAPVCWDGRLVRQALINLVNNALQAAPGGRVQVAVRQGAAHTCIDVSDDGAGVPPELREQIFAPFFTTRARGTGLGLAIVRRVAEAHGGRVFLGEPHDGPGATFVLELPAEPGTGDSPAPVPGPA